MELYELGKQYEQRATELTEYIHSLNKQLQNLTGENKLLMRRRIYMLYQDVTNLRQLAKKMTEYYERNAHNG